MLFKTNAKTTAKSSFLSVMSLGFFFGIGWTPCIGPLLSGVLILSASTATALKGGLMLFFFGLGVAFPLLILSYFSDKFDLANSKWATGRIIEFRLFGKKIITHTYNVISGIILFIIGLLMIIYKGTGIVEQLFTRFTPWSMSFFYKLNNNALASSLLKNPAVTYGGALLILVFIGYLIYPAFRKK